MEIDRVAERAPPLVGTNSKLTVHVLPVAIDPVVHGSETTIKSPVSPAVTATLLIVSGAVPQFVIVRLCTLLVEFNPALPKSMELLLKQSDGVGATPTPWTDTVAGLPAALLGITRVA